MGVGVDGLELRVSGSELRVLGPDCKGFLVWGLGCRGSAFGASVAKEASGVKADLKAGLGPTGVPRS